jgi:hypothetical protein
MLVRAVFVFWSVLLCRGEDLMNVDDFIIETAVSVQWWQTGSGMDYAFQVDSDEVRRRAAEVVQEL